MMVKYAVKTYQQFGSGLAKHTTSSCSS